MRRERELFRMAACAVAVALASASVPASAQEGSGSRAKPKNINIVFGQKFLDDKDWNNEDAGLPNVKNQTLYGLQMSFGGEKWPVSFATDLLYSSASGKAGAPLNRTVTGSTFELGLGARKFFTLSGPPISPYAGGGLAWGTGFYTCDGCSSKAPNGTGPWAEVGSVYRLGRLNAGLGFRYSSINGSDSGFKLKVGGINANAVLGFGW